MLTRKDALSSSVYCDAHNKAYQHLMEYGHFAKDEVLKEIKMRALADAIRWDIIIKLLEDPDVPPVVLAEDRELTPQEEKFGRLYPKNGKLDTFPVSENFFKKKPKFGKKPINKQDNPEKFVATGHGKKTVGYALCTEQNWPLANYYINKEATRSERTVETMITKVVKFNGNGVPLKEGRQLNYPKAPHLPDTKALTSDENNMEDFLQEKIEETCED